MRGGSYMRGSTVSHLVLLTLPCCYSHCSLDSLFSHVRLVSVPQEGALLVSLMIPKRS